MPHFSIITAFRNRDLERVKNSLDSLTAQTVQDFELIFIDYGSDAEVSAQVKPLVESYRNAHYVYAETRGMFWSRAHSLNIGIRLANGNICVLWDIDLMVENDFLAKLSNYDFLHVFTTHRCYYLPESANINNYKTKPILQEAVHSYVGLCCVQTDILTQIKGFDEYYQVWGAEDDDLYARLQHQGFEKNLIDATHIPVYHQWHATQSPALPDPWYLQMLVRLYSGKGESFSRWGIQTTQEMRPARLAFESGEYKNGIVTELITYNHTFLYNTFMQKFYQLPQNTVIYLEYVFPHLSYNTTLQKIMANINKLLAAKKRNMRVYNQTQLQQEELKQNINGFLKFFVGTHRHLFQDYHLNWNNKGFVLTIVK